MPEKIAALQKMLDESERICVFTGAGISCPSGIPDFRSANGLYSERAKGDYTPEEIISHTVFEREPELFYEFYRTKMVYPSAEPNEAHRYFAALEKTGKKVTVVTQNIDGLHQKAGSGDVVELHGSVLRNNCQRCGKFYDVSAITGTNGVPRCSCGGVIKPDVVLYEEALDQSAVARAIEAIASADLMLIIGTSLVVYPAASYVRYFRGKNLVLLNKTETPYDKTVRLAIYDDIINVVRALENLQER
ncbi:MAG: NAD-dependent protein deacylase [Bacteroides sp.]|nr:NAD-dependent protein deacylase [Eubacterium sp.]MCM1418771.1 NAD-dependent protein deacylase [Roseburia sp.]MCM1462016.1 NAD-dependent protein deacylase [Bacteroides sp.]